MRAKTSSNSGLGRPLAEATRRCYFSFATFYGKFKARPRWAMIQYLDPLLVEK